MLGAVKPPLAAFITERSWLLFKMVEAGSNWLHQHPSTWMQGPSYRYLREFFRDLQVLYDAAERTVQDVAEYAEMIRARRTGMTSSSWPITTLVV